MKYGHLLHVLTCVVLPITLAAAFWTNLATSGFSDALQRRAQLGLPRRFTHVPIAVALAPSATEFQLIFGGVENAEVVHRRRVTGTTFQPVCSAATS